MPHSHNGRRLFLVSVKFCPPLGLFFSLLIIIVNVYINEKLSPLFVFFCVQVYLNWYSLCNISSTAATMRIRDMGNMLIYKNATSIPESYKSMNYRFWHCEKCQCYTCKPTQHCIFCKKCFHFRDHHCFFLGACVLKQNVGNFILFCFYTALTCAHSLWTLGPYLYENINRMLTSDADSFNIFLNFYFPVAIVKLLFTQENNCIFLVIVFDILVSILCVSSVYGVWKLRNCITGKQKYTNAAGKQSLNQIFGTFGLLNIIFPYNGLLGTRDFNGKYQLKEV